LIAALQVIGPVFGGINREKIGRIELDVLHGSWVAIAAWSVGSGITVDLGHVYAISQLPRLYAPAG
jgi:hypothetical protein